ncbi:FAD-dependent monooxygenase [Actinomadura atramentaria]|uniref:FAD-dependent monooxygenase n=1 Tax=Actinomadura atramentaria TaxID=1990 RepID=UPI000368C80F|nr:FAD-dependent monooxygenase [Actinomadura atramentaria]
MANNEFPSILISGASVAGPALAYWLVRYGFPVTIVERNAGGPRPGGQAIDVRGPALEVAERMGVLAEIRERAVRMRGMSMVDADGREVYRSEEQTLTGGDLSSPDVEILRDDLADTIMRAAGNGVEYVFGDSIASLDEHDGGVDVVFESGARRTFGVVVGADGLHSTTRRIAFGPEESFLNLLGTYLAVWTAPNFLGLDRWQVFHQVPDSDWGGGVMSVRDNTESRVYLGFQRETPLRYDFRDIAEQKKIMADEFAGKGWVIPQFLMHMWNAPDFHFDAMAQVRLDHWSRGRVVLLGDAGYCGSPLSGQGTSMALIGAYVLAGELHRAGGDHVRAFAEYEAKLRDFVKANQDLAYINKRRVEAELEGREDPDLPNFTEVVNSYTVEDY